jgi:hypothetical protein
LLELKWIREFWRNNSINYTKESSVAGVVEKYGYEKLREEVIRALYKENLRVQLGPLLYSRCLHITLGKNGLGVEYEDKGAIL